MSTCNNIPNQIIDFIDETLSEQEHKAVKEHLTHCADCKRIALEYRLLFNAIDHAPTEVPSARLTENFKATINSNQLALQEIGASNAGSSFQFSLQTLYKIAAVVVLMLGCYWLGHYITKKEYAPAIADLTMQQEALKTVAALSLFENESASKRIQAVSYTEELVAPDEDILKALINEMLHDKLVNVRVASARALERFSEHTMVKNAYLEALKTEENASMQIELIEILAHIKETRAIPKMKELLNNQNTPSFVKDRLTSELENIL